MMGVMLPTFAQDWVYFRQGGKSKVNLLEVNEQEVVYKLWGQQDGPVYRVSRRTISQIQRGDGKAETLERQEGELNPRQKESSLRHAIMFDLMGPWLGYGALTYHALLRKGLVLEATVGRIGIGQDYHRREDYFFQGDDDRFIDGQVVAVPIVVRNQFDKNRGYFFKFGPRLVIPSTSGLEGFYLKPELIFSQLTVSGRHTYLEESDNLSVQNPEFDYAYEQVNTERGFMLNTGYFFQYRRFCLDFRAGLGYMFGKKQLEITDFLDEPFYTDESFLDFARYDFQYSHIYANTNYRKAMAISLGLSMGIAL